MEYKEAKTNTDGDVSKSETEADNLDLLFMEGDKLATKLYDMSAELGFHIINFPFVSGNIPYSPSYGVYISQLIRCASRSSYEDDFKYCHRILVERLL